MAEDLPATGRAGGRRLKLLLGVVGLCVLASWVFVRVSSAQGIAEVSFDPAQKFQTIRGWEATVDVLWAPEYDPHREEILDRMISEVGITRLRVEAFSGDENRSRSFERFLSGEIDMQGWRDLRYANVNDDDDPYHITWEGFDFADLDWRMEKTALPLMERAKARGEKIEINFNYVSFTKQIKNGIYIHTDPEEYAEFILAVFLHLRDKYGVVPDSFEPLLEPDHIKEWTPQLMGAAMAATSKRLQHAGFSPRMIAPSVSDARAAVPWLDGIMQTPGATDLLAEFSYHRYKGATPDVLLAIAARAKQAGLETSMLEYWFGNGTYALLHDDLKNTNVSAWQGRAVYGHYRIDPTQPAGHQVVLEDDMRYNRLYFNAIRPGAVRIAAHSTAPDAIDPLAFVYPDGRMAVVMRAGGKARADILGLPEGDYWLETAYASGGTPEPVYFHVGADGRFSAEIPDAGVISLRPAAP